MRIVLDTNCLVVSSQEYSDYYWLWEAFLNKKIVLCYTNEILNEYEEILSRYYSTEFAKYTIDTIVSASNVLPTIVFYKWYLIEADLDDNKFVDCAISANARYIITNDRHFNVLKDKDFPKVNTLTIDEFKTKLF